jgi:hypothetical protein
VDSDDQATALDGAATEGAFPHPLKVVVNSSVMDPTVADIT